MTNQEEEVQQQTQSDEQNEEKVESNKGEEQPIQEQKQRQQVNFALNAANLKSVSDVFSVDKSKSLREEDPLNQMLGKTASVE